MKWKPRTEVVFTASAGFPQGEYDERLPWHFRMTGRPSWKRLGEATALIARVAESKSLILCPGQTGTWKSVPKRKARAAVEVSSAEEAVAFIRENSDYRTRFFADYYVTDASYGWLTKFCHDEDWHGFLPERIACSLQVKTAFVGLHFASMPPWPPADVYE